MTNQQLGQEIKRLRLIAGLSQEELAAKAGKGLQMQRISALENGRINPTFSRLEDICNAMGVTITLVPGLQEKEGYPPHGYADL